MISLHSIWTLKAHLSEFNQPKGLGYIHEWLFSVLFRYCTLLRRATQYAIIEISRMKLYLSEPKILSYPVQVLLFGQSIGSVSACVGYSQTVGHFMDHFSRLQPH